MICWGISDIPGNQSAKGTICKAKTQKFLELVFGYV